MKQNFSVSISKTSWNNGDFKESTIYWEYQSFDEARAKYDELVSEQSVHIATLTFVKVDAVIKMCCETEILYRVKISN